MDPDQLEHYADWLLKTVLPAFSNPGLCWVKMAIIGFNPPLIHWCYLLSITALPGPNITEAIRVQRYFGRCSQCNYHIPHQQASHTSGPHYRENIDKTSGIPHQGKPDHSGHSSNVQPEKNGIEPKWGLCVTLIDFTVLDSVRFVLFVPHPSRIKPLCKRTNVNSVLIINKYE